MCAPAALAAMQFVVGAASAGVGFLGQQQAFNAQAQEYKVNADNARTAAIDSWSYNQDRADQEGQAATQQKFEANIQTAQAVGTATTAAGEGGVSGLSVDDMLGSLYAKGGRNAEYVDQNLQMQRTYLEGEQKATRADAQGQINSVPIPQAPSFASALVGVFGSGVGALDSYKRNTALYGTA